jgi:hypothetical protein
MIELTGLSKSFGRTRAVDDLTCSIESGVVTGFLGPNGAGKSTTMRMIVGLDRPSAGTATINGQKYHDLKHPLRTVGALLDARQVHPNRTARSHLRWIAASNRLPVKRVDEVLEMVGLSEVAGKRAGPFSLGMAQLRGRLSAFRPDVAPLRGCSAAIPTVGANVVPMGRKSQATLAVLAMAVPAVTLGCGRVQHPRPSPPSGEQAKPWGGQADEPFDPNYLKATDTVDHIDKGALEIHGGGVAYAVGLYAQDQSGRNGIPVRDDRTRDTLDS